MATFAQGKVNHDTHAAALGIMISPLTANIGAALWGKHHQSTDTVDFLQQITLATSARALGSSGDGQLDWGKSAQQPGPDHSGRCKPRRPARNSISRRSGIGQLQSWLLDGCVWCLCFVPLFGACLCWQDGSRMSGFQTGAQVSWSCRLRPLGLLRRDKATSRSGRY